MKRICFLSVMIILAASCRFLDEDPRGQLSPDTIVTSEANLYLTTLGNLYRRIGSDTDGEGLGGTGRGIYDLNTFTTDEALIPIRGGDWYDGGLWRRLHEGAWEVGEAPVKNAWTYLYKVIVMANQALDDLDEAEQTAQVLAWKDETKALRCLFYYYLLDLYGNVPYVTGTDLPLSEVAQVSRPVLFGALVKELRSVLPSLAAERSNAPGRYYGRMTRSVAWMLLAKLALNASVYAPGEQTEYAEGITDPMEAVLYYVDLLSSAGYGLAPEYEDNFAVFNESSIENIFTIPMDKHLYSAQNQYLFRSRHYDHAAACGFTGENGPSATLEALSANGFGTEDEDPRFAVNYWGGQALDLDGNPVEGVVYKPQSVAMDVTGTPDEKYAGARMRKYEMDPTAMKDGKLMDNDYVLFRYGDALLMQAEALWRLNRPEEALSCLNAVRVRSNAVLLESVDADVLLRERMIELAWEGHRRGDMIRFGVFGGNPLFPIPGDIIDSNPLLNQNEGY